MFKAYKQIISDMRRICNSCVEYLIVWILRKLHTRIAQFTYYLFKINVP